MDNKTNGKEKYMISIIGEQRVDGQDDRIEVMTAGNYMMKNGHHYINYKEYDSDTPDTYFNNLIKVEGELVTISRKGPVSSQLLLEKGKRHQCLYQTIAGDLMIGVFTKTLKNNLNENGGTLYFRYTTDIEMSIMSDIEFRITLTKRAV